MGLRDRAEARSFGAPKSHPKGWEPGVVYEPGVGGTITTAPLEGEPDPALWAELIADWGLDPNVTEVVPGTVQVRGWDANVGGGELKRLRYYRATLRPRQATEDRADIDELCRLIESRKPYKTVVTDTGERALVVCVSDWQMGKGEGGGVEDTVARIGSAIDQLPARIRALKKIGRPVSSVYFLCMGDLVEQCSGHYDMQAFTVELDRREQMRLVRRLLIRAVDTVAGLTDRVVLAAVPGNHGENRRDGKAYTSWTDNDDLAVVEQVAEVLAANPDRYGHVATVLADDLTLVLDIAGTPVGLAHGHQMRGSGHPAGRVHKWWEGQALGRQPVADAQVLITGHLHHLLVAETSGRTHMQCPAMDGGSAWWTSTTGQHSPSGMLTFVAGSDCGPRGWCDMEVL